jgi:hypothetical protein
MCETRGDNTGRGFYWVEQKVFAFLKRWHKQTKKFFCKTRIEKLVARFETVIASNGNHIIDKIL